MKLFLILLISLNCFANITGTELKKPSSTAFDFTFESPQNIIKETLMEQILVAINKSNTLIRRTNKVSSCEKDIFNTTYCPELLFKATEYWDHANSQPVTRAGDVVDYASKEKTTQIQTLPADIVTHQKPLTNTYYYTIASITDHSFGNGWKVGDRWTVPGATGSGFVKRGGIITGVGPLGSPTSWSVTSEGAYASVGAPNGKFERNGSLVSGSYWTGASWFQTVVTRCEQSTMVYILSAINPQSLNFTHGWKVGDRWSVPGPVASGFSERGGYILSVDIYGIPITWSLTSEGGYSSSSSSSGAFKRNGAYVNGSSWSGGVWSPVCANTTFACNGGGTLSGSSCKYEVPVMKCPAGYDPTTGNESPIAECKKTIQYTYYNYVCNSSKNAQGYDFTPVVTGGDCNKTDPNKSSVNSNLSQPCNSSTPPNNNCVRRGYTCNSNQVKPVFVENEWKCSPLVCNNEMKCGIGYCPVPQKPSYSSYMHAAYHPIKNIKTGDCADEVCDYVVNSRVSYCEKWECPPGADIIEKDGKCYKLECPAGTYLSGEKCLKVN